MAQLRTATYLAFMGMCLHRYYSTTKMIPPTVTVNPAMVLRVIRSFSATMDRGANSRSWELISTTVRLVLGS